MIWEVYSSHYVYKWHVFLNKLYLDKNEHVIDLLYRAIIKKWHVLREVLKDRHTHIQAHTHFQSCFSIFNTEGQMLYDLPWKCSCVLCIATTRNRYEFCTEYRMNVFPSDLWAVKFIKWPIFYKHINFFLRSLNLVVMQPTVWENGVILGGMPFVITSLA